MRQARQKQLNLSSDWLAFDHAKELQAIAGLLAENSSVAELVWQDLSPTFWTAAGGQIIVPGGARDGISLRRF